MDGVGLQIPEGYRYRRRGPGCSLPGGVPGHDVAYKAAGLRDSADQPFLLQKRKSMFDSGLGEAAAPDEFPDGRQPLPRLQGTALNVVIQRVIQLQVLFGVFHAISINCPLKIYKICLFFR